MTWPLAIVLLIGLVIRLALSPIDGYGYDVSAFQEWTRQMLSAPLSSFYEADLRVPQDHLPGDLWVLYALGRVWQWLGRGPFIGHDAMIALKIVPIVLDLVLAIVVAALVRPFAGDRVARVALLTIVFNPAMIFISSVWGQWNVLATSLAVVVTLALVRWGTPGIVIGLQMLAATSLVKPQFLLLLLPIAVFLLRQQRRGTPWSTLLASATIGGLGSVMLVLAAVMPFNVGFIGMDMRWTIIERVQFAADRYTQITMNAYNIWAWLQPARWQDDRADLIAGLSYQTVGFLLFGSAIIYALVVVWRWSDARIGLLISFAIITTSLFMLVTRSHERYLMEGMVFTIVAAALVPRLRLAAGILTLGYLINVWAVFGIWYGPGNRIGGSGYPAWWFWSISTLNLVGFGMLLWHAWPRRRQQVSAPASSIPATRAYQESAS